METKRFPFTYLLKKIKKSIIRIGIKCGKEIAKLNYLYNRIKTEDKQCQLKKLDIKLYSTKKNI